MSDQSLAASARILRLADGRRLAYNEWGDPTGRPVLYFHGLHSSRLALYRDSAFFAAHHIRFVTVDRPGVGLSTYQRGRTISAWPDDVTQLADALGLERFAILAITGGGAYALACAARIPQRLTGVALVSPSAPLDAPGVTIDGVMARLLTLSRRAPWALWMLYALVVPLIRRQPERVHRLVSGNLSAPDRIVAQRPEMREMQIPMFLEVFHSGYRGEARELALESGGWGFRLDDITAPVQIWDGDQNNLIPPQHAAYLARVIPGARLHICHGEGHLLIVDHMEEIISGILDVADTPSAPSDAAPPAPEHGYIVAEHPREG